MLVSRPRKAVEAGVDTRGLVTSRPTRLSHVAVAKTKGVLEELGSLSASVLVSVTWLALPVELAERRLPSLGSARMRANTS